VSTTLDDPSWNNTKVIKDDVAAEIAQLKQEPGGDILVNGRAQLVQTLMENDLVDEYRIMIFPVVLGEGKRLFGDFGDSTSLRLADSRPVGDDGVVILTYEPVARADA
jgi:dihydrofolate reductase